MDYELPGALVTEGSGPILRQVPITIIQPESTPPFDVYIRHRGKKNAILYCEHHTPFTAASIEKLRSNRIDTILVNNNQWTEFRRYVETHLGAVLADKSIDTQTRAGFIYDSAQGLIHEAMDHPRSGEIYKRTQALAANVTPFLREEKGTLNHLMQVASFDYYTYTHSVNVFFFSNALAQHVDLGDEHDIRDFGTACLLHDVGKSQIDSEVLNAKGPLSEEGWQQMKMHPVYGYDMLVEQGGFSDLVLDVVRHHHEKLDGTGYPDGMKASELNRFVRVSTICDIFDALTTKRSYKTALDSFPALKLMQSECDGQLDKELFQGFIKLMSSPDA